MDTIITTIKREGLREIVAGRKRIEYREIKPLGAPSVWRHSAVSTATHQWDVQGGNPKLP